MYPNFLNYHNKSGNSYIFLLFRHFDTEGRRSGSYLGPA